MSEPMHLPLSLDERHDGRHLLLAFSPPPLPDFSMK